MYEWEHKDEILEERVRKKKKSQKRWKIIKRIIRIIIIGFLAKEWMHYWPMQYNKYLLYKEFKTEISSNYINNPETINRWTYTIEITTGFSQIDWNLTALNNAWAIWKVQYTCKKNKYKTICKVEEDQVYNFDENHLIKIDENELYNTTK